MSRRFRWSIEEKRLVEVSPDFTGAEKRAQTTTEALVYGGLGTATDGTPINTRTAHARYLRENGLALSSDYVNTWAKAKAERESAFNGQGTPESRREVRDAVGRALYESKKRR